ncbi:MAG: nucleotidyl transferase AbiEii/AbiGii toxin family protein [Bifidobacterium crudilactis]|uniref:nucleotidyl transferase AbiEii/AbiGii toxin family protein n=1 Tax=Bifidobacterium crudilactis TaxID=327277 RepID=UPI003F98377A
MTDDMYAYPSATAVESAIKSAAKAEHTLHPERQISDLIRQAHYDRFLSRIFSEKEESPWVLKGGSAMLARIPSTRRTLDADLFSKGYDIQSSLEELKRLAAIDLHDHFVFEFDSATAILQADNQPYQDGYRVVFTTRLGVKTLNPIHVDLVANQGTMPRADVMTPANRLPLDKLTTYPYRLYTIPCQFADKVCAVVQKINGRESSRIKDLVDLAIIAATQRFEATEIEEALSSESVRRKLPYPIDFAIPRSWTATQFRNTALGTAVKGMSITQAHTLIQELLNGLYARDTTKTLEWDPSLCAWAVQRQTRS